MSSCEEITEITTPNTKKKYKRKKQHNDSIQIIKEISKAPDLDSTIDTSVEILSEHSVKSKSPVETTEVLENTKETDNVDNSGEKAEDFISFSSPSVDVSSQSQSTSSTFESSQDSQEEESNDLFQIDRAPCSDGDKYTYVPKYVSKFSETALSEEKKAEKSWRQAAMCFNCGGEHAIRDCKKPRNQHNINKNRNIFWANKTKQMGNVSASRYHLDHHQKFAHIKPGIISKRLRRALKLSSDQLPLHVYRMRLVGYPPAWLEEAKVKHSGIAVFDSLGQAMADPEDEDGEVEVDRCKYDMKKLIEYPGFNIRPPKGTLNESDYLGFPDMLPEQHKDRMMSHLAPRAALPYKKRKMTSKATGGEQLNHTGESIRNSTDMEVDEVPETKFEAAGNCAFIPALPDEPLPPPPPTPSSTPPPPGVEEEKEDGEIVEEEDKEDKEKKGVKRKAEDEAVADLETSSKKRKSDSPSTSTTADANVSSGSTLNKSSSLPSLGSIKLLDLGTPIIKHAESAEKLPSHEAFSKNICDVINFDNLPNSTGKYKVLSKAVKKVRALMNKITGNSS